MIHDQWPAIVEIHFTSLGKALDPYSLEWMPKALEYDFYLVSKVEGNSDEGFNYFQDGSEVGTVSPNE
ncbi:8672_t:CDS:2 [Gigaspora margarita]|uniref:8672_t:CDS:1 n=1 Tax=Gigaspora margarita TaxID=4874 RepID=A0ABN7W676_GIGMA|nr:8672_t:CDS:2 [Gigaspora margarita]